MRNLDATHQANLTKCTRRTTLEIEFSNGTQMNLATSDVVFGSKNYLGLLAPGADLNLDATEFADAVKLQISNVKLELGRTLINTADILSDTDAVYGCYFKIVGTNSEWHNVKLDGKIKVGNINRRWIDITFESITSAVEYAGQSIAQLFPDLEIPLVETPVAPSAPLPVFNDLENVRESKFINKLSPFLEDNQYGGRYYLPEFEKLRSY